MTAKKIIIIGGGIAGFSTGCYAQMNDYQTQIFEMHNLPGGLCTSWKRKDYLIDGCIHDLAGAGETSRIHFLWEELHALPNGVHFHDEFWRVEGPSGQMLRAYTNIDRMEAHLRDISPADHKVIRKLIKGARMMTRFELFAILSGVRGEMLRMLPHLPGVIHWATTSMEKFAHQFRHPFLRQAFPMLQYDFPGVPMLIYLNFLANTHLHQIGTPVGGSLAFARAIANRYQDLGGELHTSARVTKILVENDLAVGVKLANGEEHRADVVVSCADGFYTIYGMLEGKFTNDAIDAYYSSVPDHSAMNTHIALGVKQDLSGETRAITLLLKEPVELAGNMVDHISVEIFGYDKTFAPDGKTVLKVLTESSYDFWKKLSTDPDAYAAAKQKCAQTVIAVLENRFPGLSNDVEVIDVGTPLTIERFTGNYHGTQAWFPKGISSNFLFKGLSKTLPGLGNFYMVGQWMGGAIGINTVAYLGRKFVEQLCMKDQIPFYTET
jgi:phytoene dehydrogenase-like protein